MSYDQNLLETDLVIDSAAGSHLKESAAWGKFLGITGFVISSIVAVIGMAAGFSVSRLGSYSGPPLDAGTPGASHQGLLAMV